MKKERELDLKEVGNDSERSRKREGNLKEGGGESEKNLKREKALWSRRPGRA